MKNDFPSLTAATGESVVLRSVDARGHLDGLLLSMTLHQVFRNDTGRDLEVTYTFPLAWGTVLLGMQVTLGGRRLAGRVMARREARERYEDAVEQGDAPVMVERAQGGVFSASIGSLRPGEEARIELTYAQLLSFEQGRIRLVVPTTIAPRYGDAVRQGGLQADQVVGADLLAEYRFSLSITLAGALGQARIGSPSHAVAQQRDSGVVVVSLQGQAWLDRDFVLLLEGLEGRSFAVAGPDPLSGDGHVALVASYCPDLPDTPPAPLRLKILVDCSGSMAGDSMALARAALRPLATRLAAADQVAYSRFGDRPQRVLGAMEGTADGIAALVRAIDETQADLGGTELGDALADTFALPMGAARHAQEADVLLVTDGEVWDAQRIVEEACRSGHRVYALGVGSAPAESLLREMAEATGGACEFTAPGEDLQQAVERLLARIRHALPVQGRLALPQPALWASALPRRMASGETAHLFLRMAARPPEAPALQLDGGGSTQAELSLREDDLVARLVAARQVGMTAGREQARELAERYQLVTDDTNLLLVIERDAADRTDGMPDLHQVRPMLAAGWGGTGQVVHTTKIWHSRRSSTASQMQFCSSNSSALGLDDMGNLHLPSVWRTNHIASAFQVDALASGGTDDFEISAFLCKQADGEGAVAPSPRRLASATRSERPQVASVSADAAQILAAFNQAASQGQPFRQTLRAVTALTLSTPLCQAILQAGRHVGGPLKAWACYLLWLHEGDDAGLRLTPEALALALGQVKGVLAEAFEAASLAFEALPAKA